MLVSGIAHTVYQDIERYIETWIVKN
jgi:hypothetical protein